MNIEEVEKKLKAIETTNLHDSIVTEFNQLLGFIDSSLSEVAKKDLAEKSQLLTSAIMSIRDYMQKALSQDAYRKFILAEIDIASKIEVPVQAAEPESQQAPSSGTVQKKSTDLEHE